MTFTTLLIVHEDDIQRIRSGQTPNKAIRREFHTQADVDSYSQGISSIETHDGDMFILTASGNSVRFNRTDCGSENDEDALAYSFEITFDSTEEANAFCQGSDDSCGFTNTVLLIEKDGINFTLASDLGLTSNAVTALA